jgi:hypothetical protein
VGGLSSQTPFHAQRSLENHWDRPAALTTVLEETLPPPTDDTGEDRLTIELRAPGEWIVSADGAVRALHIYRLAPSDWLVSEVGRGNESRGPALADALAALAAGGVTLAWWRDVVTALDA